MPLFRTSTGSNLSRFMAVITAAFLASFLSLSPAQAKIVAMETFKDWTVYRGDTEAGRLCYMSTEPKKLRGDYDRNNRGETRIFVTHGPGKADRNVVSVLAGYKYKKQSDVTFNIDGNKTTLFTMDNRAWALGPEDDSKLVTRMKRGNKLVVTGISSRGNTTIDDYSLSGFTKAKAFMDKLCK